MKLTKIVDESGKIIPGLLRSNTGCVVAADSSAYTRYRQMVETKTELETLREQVASLSDMVKALLNKQVENKEEHK